MPRPALSVTAFCHRLGKRASLEALRPGKESWGVGRSHPGGGRVAGWKDPGNPAGRRGSGFCSKYVPSPLLGEQTKLHGKQQQQLVSHGAFWAGIGAVGLAGQLAKLVQEHGSLQSRQTPLPSTLQGSSPGKKCKAGWARLCREGPGQAGGCYRCSARRAHGILREPDHLFSCRMAAWVPGSYRPLLTILAAGVIVCSPLRKTCSKKAGVPWGD